MAPVEPPLQTTLVKDEESAILQLAVVNTVYEVNPELLTPEAEHIVDTCQ